MNEIAIEIKNLLNQEYKRKDICEILGISVNNYKSIQAKYKLNQIDNTSKLYMNKEWLESMYKKYNSAQKIAEICNVKSKTITAWRKKFEIPKCDMSTNAKKYSCNYDYFSVIDTEEKAYWLGFIMADGCVSQKGDNNYITKISLSSKDSNHIYKFLKSIESTHKVWDAQYVNNLTGKLSFSSTISINNTKMAKDLISKGCIKSKTGSERIPNIDKKLIRHFIRGFFDGDGCISFYNNRRNYSFELCSASIEIMIDIKNILEKETGYEINFKKNENGKYSVDFYIMKIMNVKKNLAIYKYLFDNATIYLDRKYERVQTFINSSSTK